MQGKIEKEQDREEDRSEQAGKQERKEREKELQNLGKGTMETACSERVQRQLTQMSAWRGSSTQVLWAVTAAPTVTKSL